MKNTKRARVARAGGKARAAKMTPAERSASARTAAQAHWGNAERVSLRDRSWVRDRMHGMQAKVDGLESRVRQLETAVNVHIERALVPPAMPGAVEALPLRAGEVRLELPPGGVLQATVRVDELLDVLKPVLEDYASGLDGSPPHRNYERIANYAAKFRAPSCRNGVAGCLVPYPHDHCLFRRV